MKVNDTLESINRIWDELSVIVVTHAIALAVAVYSGAVAPSAITERVSTLASTQNIASLGAALRIVGLELSYLVAVAVVVYIVMFQRASAALLHAPTLRLSYSQPALWRAGKSFDELRHLVILFDKFTASAALADVEITLALGITQYAKEFEDHHRQQLGAPLAAAALWARYYSGFCLLGLVSLGIGIAGTLTAVDQPRVVFLVPIGLAFAAAVARCGWEAQIEKSVVGRLRFALDCAIVSGSKREMSSEVPEPPAMPDKSHLDWDRTLEGLKSRQALQAPHRLELELQLAAELVMLPPPGLPYGNLWLLHLVRQLPVLRNTGSLSFIRNDEFRTWLRATLAQALAVAPLKPEYARRYEYESREISETHDAHPPWFDLELEPALHQRLDASWQRVLMPDEVPDDRVIARLLRTRPTLRLINLVASRSLLLDEPRLYFRARHQARDFQGRGRRRIEPLRKWVSRRRAGDGHAHEPYEDR